MDAMKKPVQGDQLTIRYDGAIVRARCDDVTETVNGGPGAASFTIVSPTRFERGKQAHLLQGPNEMPVQVVRVTTVGHHRVSKINVILFSGVFDGTLKSEPSPAPVARP